MKSNKFLNFFINKGIDPDKLEPEDLRKIQYLNLALTVLIISLFAVSTIEYFFLGEISNLILKVALLIFSLRFFFARRNIRNYLLTAVIFTSLVLGTLLIWLFIIGLNTSLTLALLLIPPFVFSITGVIPGMIWSIFGLIWFAMLIVMHYLGIYGDSIDANYVGMIAIIYFFNLFLSYNYERTLQNSETNFAAKKTELERLIYIISHDLRSPLTSIKGFISFLKDDIRDKDTKNLIHDFKRVEEVSKSMESMINDLLNLSRIGRDQDTTSEINTQELVNKVLTDSESLFKMKKIAVDTVGAFPIINANQRKFEEILRNLVSNAIKYIGSENPAPRITIGVNDNPFEYAFYVKDNGIGIDPQFQDKLFGLFYQLDISNRQSSGIGLSVVKGFVQDLGGKVWVESEKDKGSTFWFTIPKISQNKL
jgi:signal transduction histidine kinase